MDSGDKFFFHNFICSSDDSSSDDEEIVAAALVVHDHINREWPRFRGQYKGHVKGASVILEVMASQDLWIWHSFFGMAGSHNGIGVLQRSSVFARLAEGHYPEVNFEVNGHKYKKGYYLVGGIYPQWSTLVKIISNPQGEKRQRFAQMQESAKKDVECAFGVLQS
ncbi:uncharacterized protein [Aegilops tauschii subsp. strangulata]|uniref:uncharacterized protein n=1 Tax=Aegilops tauschii subsp. strangulata TaxID=200361 RepID=UPI00098B994E|nr:uncharacterized protein LOC109757328 [Aegilops tauschii subsp. strangulata]